MDTYWLRSIKDNARENVKYKIMFKKALFLEIFDKKRKIEIFQIHQKIIYFLKTYILIGNKNDI